MMSFRNQIPMSCRIGSLAILIIALATGIGYAQPRYDIQVNIERTVQKNFLGIPSSVDYNVSWRVMENSNGQMAEVPSNTLSNYEVHYAGDDSTFASASIVRPGQVNTTMITGLDVGAKYYFRVQATDANNQLYRSSVVWIRTGREADLSGGVNEDLETSWTAYFPLHGRFPLTMLGQGLVYDRSTFLGKASFWALWWFILIGLLIWYSCIRNLSLAKIFPLEKYSLRLNIPFQYESVFEKRKHDKFFGNEGIIHRWKNLIESTAGLLDKPPKMEGDKTLDFDRLRIHFATWWRDNGRSEIQNLQKDISPYCNKYSTARIIRAGLANHEINGFKFMAASQEVDRAIENRAMMELEQLKGKSKIEWLWNLGATAPLIGLFGTVTGISISFRNLAAQSQRGAVDSSAKITELAGGINEALWTTIFGLTAGILLVVLYYVFKNKLDWIYGKWEEIYVDVSEKL